MWVLRSEAWDFYCIGSIHICIWTLQNRQLFGGLGGVGGEGQSLGDLLEFFVMGGFDNKKGVLMGDD